MGAAPGVAEGPIWRYAAAPGGERVLLDVRVAAGIAAGELSALAERLRRADRPDDAAILDAQAMMAEDPMLLDLVEARAGASPPSDAAALAGIVEAVAESIAGELAALPDETLAARAADVRDVGARIARLVAGQSVALPERPSIAVADDLPPSVAAEVEDGLLLGIALERGSTTSHAAILARGLGIPAVVGVRGLLAAAADGRTADDQGTLAIDGDAGTVILDPGEDERAELARLVERRRATGAAARALRGEPGQTADGQPIGLLANIGRVEDLDRALEAGAEGVGLFRTEFLFVGRQAPPTEDEQVDAYRRVMAAFGERPVVIRLIDVGGDKPLPYLRLPTEPNPFLGVRGFRLVSDHRDMLREQVRAIARAGAGGSAIPWLMAPMIATVEDVERLHELVNEALAELDGAGIARARRLAIGIMIEVPSATLLAAELARRVDFFSIGSNDLTQYVLAMDRTHPDLAAAADGLHPAVLRAIAATVAGARSAEIEVAVCGELAGDPAGALILAGLGIRHLSMDAGRLDATRLALRGATSEQLAELAATAIAAETAGQVRALAQPWLAAEPG